MHLKVMFSVSSIKITPDLVRLTAKQNYPWKEKNRPEFLEKNQQPKDKMQTESLMVHSFINGNLTKALFSVLSAPPNSPPFHLPVTYSWHTDLANTIYKEGMAETHYFIRKSLHLTSALVEHWSNL